MWNDPLTVLGAWQYALAEGIWIQTTAASRDPIAMSRAPNHTHERNMQ
jgi:hypothetical protein